MKCYHCGATLTKHNFCTACKRDVRQYKQVLEAANRKYNEGLDKAQIRDLTGAVIALKQCLKLNKEHVDARNLLGLVYFEMGEVVLALSEWVISKNLQPEKNIASHYIAVLQENQGKLDTCNQAIHKFNTALELCDQGSDDLAIIQLKKVILMHPNFVKAYLLLALLYMAAGHYEKATPVLKKLSHIDRGNTQGQRYMREISLHNKQKGVKTKAKEKDPIVRYERDNEIIIQPAEVIEPNASKSGLAGFAIGFLLGAFVLFFLVMPNRIAGIRNEMENEVRIANENREAQTVTINALNNELDLLKDKLAQYGELYNGEGNSEAVSSLLNAVATYLENTNNKTAVMPYLDVCVKNESFFLEEGNTFLDLYNAMKRICSPEFAEAHYQKGLALYDDKKYQDAVTEFELAVGYYDGNANSNYYLGSAYDLSGNKEQAKEAYQRVISKFPGSQRATQAERALNAIQ